MTSPGAEREAEGTRGGVARRGGDPGSGSEPVKAVVDALGAVTGVAAIIYFVGTVVLAIRYEGLGLPSKRAAVLAPREYAFAIGFDALVTWTLVAGIGAFIITDVLRRTQGWRRNWLWHTGWVAMALISLVVLLVSDRWVWLALAGVALLALLVSTRDTPRALQIVGLVGGVALVTVAWEADRKEYVLDRAEVDLSIEELRAIVSSRDAVWSSERSLLLGPAKTIGRYIGPSPTGTAVPSSGIPA